MARWSVAQGSRMLRTITRVTTSVLTFPFRVIKLGRIFRRMGLPPWTFAGIGITAIWFSYVGVLLEKSLGVMLGASGAPTGLRDFLPPLIVFLVPFVVVILIGAWHSLRNQLSKRSAIAGNLHKPKDKKGLILLVSRPESALHAVDYYLQLGCLEQVWLLPSDSTDVAQFGSGTLQIADTIEQQIQTLAQQLGRTVSVHIHRKGVSAADSQDTFDVVNRIFRQSGYEPHELIADFTGGTKPMTIGMIMACLPADRDLEYVSYANGQSHGPFLVDYQHRAFDLIA